MNGEEQTFFRELLDEKFNNVHHRFNEIKDDLHAQGEKLATLPCLVHVEKIANIEKDLQSKFKLATWVSMFVLVGILGGFWWVLLAG